MEQPLEYIFAGSSFLILSGLVAAALFFAMAGLREIKESCLEGLLYLALSLFFVLAHFFLLFNTTSANCISHAVAQPDFWGWLISLLAPALIVLYLGFGLFSLLTARFREALVKTFFGLTLACYLYILGPHWPVDVRGILTLIWCGTWFDLELKTAL
jgi:hypothetical protein